MPRLLSPARRSSWLARSGLACVLLLACSRNEAMRQTEVSVVAISPQDQDHVLLSPVPTAVQVRLRGSREQLDELEIPDPIQIDLRTAPARVELSPSSVHVPEGVTVVALEPSSFDLSWDVLALRDVPLRITVIGAPADGFAVRGEPTSEPATVPVRGPKARVDAISWVEAGPLDVNGLVAGAHTQRVALAESPAGVRCEALSVEAKVGIVPLVAKRTRR